MTKRDFEAEAAELIRELRESEVMTAADMAITVNARDDAHGGQSAPAKGGLRVVVNGMPVVVEAGSVADVIRQAIENSGQIGAPIEQWELRTREGDIIPPDADPAEWRLSGGTLLFLNLGVPKQQCKCGHGSEEHSKVSDLGGKFRRPCDTCVCMDYQPSERLAPDAPTFTTNPIVQAAADRIRLWLVQNKRLPYAGSTIELEEVLVREIDHALRESQGATDQPEVCVVAAIRLDDGQIFVGPRHYIAMQWLPNGARARSEQQGFLTSRGRFVGRVEGRQLQEFAGIASASPDGYRGDELFSEDLYPLNLPTSLKEVE